MSEPSDVALVRRLSTGTVLAIWLTIGAAVFLTAATSVLLAQQPPLPGRLGADDLTGLVALLGDVVASLSGAATLGVLAAIVVLSGAGWLGTLWAVGGNPGLFAAVLLGACCWALFVTVAVVEGRRSHRAAERYGLLWLLTVSAERGMPLAAAVRALAGAISR